MDVGIRQRLGLQGKRAALPHGYAILCDQGKIAAGIDHQPRCVGVQLQGTLACRVLQLCGWLRW